VEHILKTIIEGKFNQEGYAKLVSHDAPIQVCLAKARNTAVNAFRQWKREK
jgi:hypothetical protein